MLLLSLVCAIAVCFAAEGEAFDQRSVFSETTFRTEPTFELEYFFVESITNDLTLLAPGYIFINPVSKKGSTGPQIYAQDGSLIWYGGSDPERRQQDFHACDYLGGKGDHLCYSEMLSHDLIQNLNPSNKVVYDNTYTEVRRYNTSIGKAFPNLHEFNLVENGESYIQPVYPYVQMDLTHYGGTKQGYLWDSCFQENSARTANPIFEWCWLDYYPEWQTSIFPTVGTGKVNVTSPKAGEGTIDTPFDPAHLNAIDKNSEGDYLVSLRHADQVLKIAGPENIHGVRPGTTLWRLGGKTNDFTYEGNTSALLFSKQHHVRYLSTSGNETIFSLLDNAWEGCTDPSANASSGKIISINNETMTARILHVYPHPDGDLTPSQASMSVLSNGNAFVGWGALSDVSEFAPDGRVLFHATFTTDFTGDALTRDHSYRAFKAPWVGKPATDPKLLAYSRTCTTHEHSPLIAWVSWNGATEVKAWRFSISGSGIGPWFDIGTFPRSGFETEVVLLNTSNPSPLKFLGTAFAPFVMATALNARGMEIGKKMTETFVPNSQIEASCNAVGCFAPTDRFEYLPAQSCGRECGRSLFPLVIACILLFLVIEYTDYSYLSLISSFALRGLKSRTHINIPIELLDDELESQGSRLHSFEDELTAEEMDDLRHTRDPLPRTSQVEGCAMTGTAQQEAGLPFSSAWPTGHKKRKSYDRRDSGAA